jgi:hypothetical protein
MTEQRQASIAELLADHAVIDEAIRRAMRDAVLRLARAGQAVATWQNGKVVWIPAEEILSRLDDGRNQ